MDKTITLKLLLSILLIMLMYPKTESHWLPHRPLGPVHRPMPRPRPMPTSPITTPLCESQFTLANRGCAMIPYVSVPPPMSRHHRHRHHSSHSHNHSHNHNHSHSHSSSHHNHRVSAGNGTITPTEEECCRWLKEVDNVCVCDVLVHLPIFLSKPVHNYTVVVNEACEVTFQCGSRMAQV